MCKPPFVVVDADVTRIDGSYFTVRGERDGDGVEIGAMHRFVWHEDVGFNGARQQRVVDAPEHVAFGISRRHHGLGDECAGITTAYDPHADSSLSSELRKDALARRERIVGQKCECHRLICGSRRVAGRSTWHAAV